MAVIIMLMGSQMATAQQTSGIKTWWHKNVAKYTEGGMEKTVPVYYRITEYDNVDRGRKEGAVTQVYFKEKPNVSEETAVLLEFPHGRQSVYPSIENADNDMNKNYHTISRIGILSGNNETVKLDKVNFPSLYEMVIGENTEQMVANLEDNNPAGVYIQALTIKSTNLKEIPALMCQNCSKLKKLTFAPGCKVGAIGKWAFLKTGLEGELEIPTDIPVIAERAFENNDYVTKVVFKDRNNGIGTVTQEIGQYAFAFSDKITSVVFEHGVKEIGANAFHHSPINQPIPFPEGLEKIGDMSFNFAHIIGDLHLPQTLKVIGNQPWGATPDNPGWMFYNGIHFPRDLEDIGNFAFYGSRKVEKLVIPNTIKRLGLCSFATVPLVGDITIPSSVTRMENAVFSACGGLEHFFFEANSNLYLGDRQFKGCDNLKYVDMTKVNSQTILDGLKTKKANRDVADNPFGMAQKYTLIYLPQNLTYEERSTFMADGQENFIMKKADGSLCCDNFKVYDQDAAYQKLNFYTSVPAQIQANPQEKVTFEELQNKYPYSVRGCDYEIPYAFTADKAAYERKFTANTLNIFSVSLPYGGASLASGVKAYKLVKEMDMAGSLNEKGLWFVSLDDSRLINKTANEAAGKLESNHPYVLRFTDAGLLTTHKFEATGVEVKSTKIGDGPADGSLWKFINTNVNVYNGDAAAQKLYMLNGSTKTWHAVSTDNTNGFFHSFRGAMQYMGSGAAKDFPKFIEPGETTGIKSADIVPAEAKTVVYTVDGRRVEGSLDNAASGIYVVNGKKVVK